MNILRALFRDSSLGSEILNYAEDGIILTIDGFSSPSWAIRNASQILLGNFTIHCQLLHCWFHGSSFKGFSIVFPAP